MITLLSSGAIALVSAISLHVLHARIARDLPDRNVSTGRVLLEITPSTLLARAATRGALDHPLASLYRAVWFVHMGSGLVFALALMLSAFVAIP